MNHIISAAQPRGGAIRHYDTVSRFVLWWTPYQNYEIQLVHLVLNGIKSSLNRDFFNKMPYNCKFFMKVGKKIEQAVAQRTSMTHSSQVSQHKFSDQFCLTLIFVCIIRFILCK